MVISVPELGEILEQLDDLLLTEQPIPIELIVDFLLALDPRSQQLVGEVLSRHS
jgi:hypothetical protein